MSGNIGYKVLSLGGLALAVVMGVLMKIGTTDGGLFVVWGVLLVAGAGLFALGRKLDSDARGREIARERQARLDAARVQGGTPRD